VPACKIGAALAADCEGQRWRDSLAIRLAAEAGEIESSRAPGPITSALCWAHARRQFFELADVAANARWRKGAAAISPVALEVVKRIDALFDFERGINGLTAEERLRVRQNDSAPLVTALEALLRAERSRLSRAASVAR
jgi:transposase